MIAPDEKTFDTSRAARSRRTGDDWDAAVGRWQSLVTDEGARYDRSVHLDGGAIWRR